MLWIPNKGCVEVITNGGIVGTASPWTAVPEGGTTNTYGAVTELISAANNNQESWGIEILITGTGASATASQAMCDILIGGATDDVLVSSLVCGHAITGASQARYFFPVHIPQGKRIAAQLSSVRTAITDPRVGVWLYGGSPPPFRMGRKVTTYGTKIDNSRGQAVVPTASGGAASVTEMTASTSEGHFYCLPGFQAATDTTITPAGWVNIGIGIGAATEQRIGTWWYGKDTGENLTGPWPSFGSFCPIPSGSRLTMLASNSGTNDAAYDGLIYCVS